MPGPTTAHDEPVTVERLLAHARAGLLRLTPEEAARAQRAGAILIDIRADRQRDRDGTIPGARVVPRNVLEWRLDPLSPHRHPSLACPEAHVVLLCHEGYQSSLAAATLQRLGLPRATDVIGGFRAWRAAGLPVRGSDEEAAARDAGGGRPPRYSAEEPDEV